VKDSVTQLSAELKSNQQIARYVGGFFFTAQVEKVFTEMTGQKFPETQKISKAARHMHSHAHGLAQVVS
jgi:hypothetical protein